MIRARFVAPAVLIALVNGCVSPSDPEHVAVVQPIEQSLPTPTPAPTPRGPTTFVYEGELTQGGWLRGQAPAGTARAWLGGTSLVLDGEGRFFAAFDRDAADTATLRAELADGRAIASPLTVSPRAWDIERVSVARLPGGPTDDFMKTRQPELDRIAAARAVDHPVGGWRQQFVWPAKGASRAGSARNGSIAAARRAPITRASTSPRARAGRSMRHRPTAWWFWLQRGPSASKDTC
jgi:hypothetical protein